VRRDVRAQARLDLLQGARRVELDVVVEPVCDAEVPVRVVEARHDDPGIGREHPCPLPAQELHLRARPGRDDALAAHGQGFHPGPFLVGREDAALDDQVGRLLLGSDGEGQHDHDPGAASRPHASWIHRRPVGRYSDPGSHVGTELP
jgi:hypothetical protein